MSFPFLLHGNSYTSLYASVRVRLRIVALYLPGSFIFPEALNIFSESRAFDQLPGRWRFVVTTQAHEKKFNF